MAASLQRSTSSRPAKRGSVSSQREQSWAVTGPAHIPAWCAAVTVEKGLDSFKSTVEKVLALEKSKVYFRQRRTNLRLAMPLKKILVLEIND